MRIFFMLILGFILNSKIVFGNPAFFISEVPVFAEDITAVKAKEKALNQGQYEAFLKLIAQLTNQKDKLEIPVLLPEEVMGFVENVSITREQTTPTLYKALVSVQFKEKEVKDWLKNYNIPFLKQLPPTVLVLPVFQNKSEITFLEERNPFYQILKNEIFPSLYSLKIPVGDLEDMTLFNMDKFYSGDFNGLEALIKKYKVDQTLIVEIKKEDDFYSVKTKTYPNVNSLSEISVVMRPKNIEDENISRQVVQKLLEKLDERWREGKTNLPLELKEMLVVVPISSLEDWASIRNKMEQISGIEKMSIQALKKDQALVNLSFQMSYPDIIQAFKMKNLILRQTEIGEWIVEDVFEGPVETENSSVTPINLLK